MTLERSIALRISADPAFLSVARMFGNSVAKTFELDPERTEDLRLALSEICAATVEGAPGAAASRSIDVDVSWDQTAIRFSCPSIPLATDGARWVLLQALMPDIHIDDAAPPTVTFSVAR